MGPILYSSDATPDGGCETANACDALLVDCSNKALVINGMRMTFDAAKKTIVFSYGDAKLEIKLEGGK